MPANPTKTLIKFKNENITGIETQLLKTKDIQCHNKIPPKYIDKNSGIRFKQYIFKCNLN